MTTDTMAFPLVNSCRPANESVDAEAEHDFNLAQAAGKGDLNSFEEIYSRHHKKTYSLCKRMLGDPFTAEDLTQEVYIKLFQKVGQFRGDAKFTTWLHRFTVNQVLMYLRKNHYSRDGAKHRKIEESIEDLAFCEQIAPGTENPFKMSILDKIALDRAIEELPDGYKNVFLLHDQEGHEHKEVAERLGISEGTSKSQLHKARLKLRKLLKKKANPRLARACGSMDAP